MCGISGIYAFTKQELVGLQKIEADNNTLAKRGPDSGKVLHTANGALGHRRLSIIDVSCAGDQPMTTLDGRYTIIFNGEIFNFAELRDEYLPGEELRSHSDTEVFLLLYARLKEKTF